MFLCLGWFELSNDGYSGRCPVNEKEVVMASADDMNLIAYNYPVDCKLKYGYGFKAERGVI